ncbi:uroporphyrinogen-III synthase [Chitinophaga pinensis]|uniref:Uroporphyrinogen III synthase HEM4 n=1 Tax=Chitinophaga pinensis (strain ATCC 43595 / DSM 2588 / LMG 13176 / NBRC 15968 / NCIMB 11800 / UQM 2034) TaxID=485918 RepID=A0A979H0Z4_CHIPD|nr:uroporphyrinogen-III synthase [Chitinophaga pinensis]ACU63905.1 Uroporphyrinogen III synthase HEM4 [Chitinophaga pinensis DSM 2588]
MPSNKRYRILSTRAVDPELVSSAAEQSVDIIPQAFIRTRPRVDDRLLQQVQQLLKEKVTVVFTSVNAVNAIQNLYFRILPADAVTEQANMPGWDVYCLEGATKEALSRTAIPHNITGTAANAAMLAQTIVRNEEKGPLVFFCGDRRRDELPDILRQRNIGLNEVIVYETTETPAVTGATYDGIFFLSPSAVQSFFSVNHLAQHTVCFSIGPTTAAALEQHTNNKIIISTGQRMADMVQTAIFYFNNIN